MSEIISIFVERKTGTGKRLVTQIHMNDVYLKRTSESVGEVLERTLNELRRKLDEEEKAMPFGQYKGQPMQDVPASYLHYLWTNGLKDDKSSNVADYIRRNLDALKKEHPDGIWS